MRTGNRHILVVDDNPSIHDDFRKIFGGFMPDSSHLDSISADLFGPSASEKKVVYQMDFAFQGQEALEKVRAALINQRPYAMAFLDVQMPPGWDGIQTMSEIWKIAPDLQIVICTAYSTYSLEEIRKVGHADQFVVLKKPFDAIEVLQMANVFSEKWELLNQVRERARKLEESQHRYRFLAEATPGLVWTATTNGNVDYFNTRWTDYTGLPVEEGKNWNWQSVIHPEDLPACLGRWTRALQTGENYETEYRIKRADGVYRWHLGRAMPMRGDRGDILHWVGTCTDIDDKKRAEKALLLNNAELEKRVTERTAELSQSESRYRELLDSQDDGVGTTDAVQAFTFANPALGKILGVPAEQLMGRNIREFLHGDQKNILDRQIELRKAGRKSSYEIEVHSADGERRQLLVNASPKIDLDGRYCGTFAVFRDITERKRTEEKLHLQTSALVATANGIVICDKAGRILWVNPAFTRLTGYRANEAIGQSPAMLKSGEHRPEFYQAMWKTILDKKTWHGELVNCRKDGSTYHEEMTITPVLDDRGAIKHFVAVKQDISRRKQDEEHVRAREEAFRALADNVPDAVARIDRKFRFAYGNRALAIEIGHEPAAFLGKDGAQLGLPMHDQWCQEFRQVFETGQPRTFEFNWQGRDGICYRESRLVPERASNGSVEFVLAVTRDVTEQKKLEQERQLMDLQLRQAQKLEAVGQLAAGIAHEINTPTQYVGDNTQFLKDAFANLTTALKGYTELIAAAKQNAVTPELIKHAEEVLVASDLDYHMEQIPAAINETLEGVARVSKIVRAMKEFSHPGAKEKAAADLNKAIDSTVTVARNEWKYIADVVLELDPELPMVPCFISEFNQSVLNLVVNASHAIGDAIRERPGKKGTITIRTRREGDHAEVRVSDTGTGIPEAHRQKIFEPFFTTKDVGKGTGQGLTVVYGSIVKKHGGTVTFETEMDKGTTFILRLPLGSKPAALSEASNGHANLNLPQAAASAV